MSISYRPAGKLPVALAALAAITAVPAGAAVITVSGLNANVAAGSDYDIDTDHDGNWNIKISNRYSSLAGTANVQVTGTTGRAVAAGTLIGPLVQVNAGDPKYYPYSVDLDRSSATSQVDNVIGDNVYVPISFTTNAVAKFGWLDLSIHNPNLPGAPVTAAYQVTVNGYGYDNTGAAVIAGATATSVPEPSSLLLLAAGFAGFSAMRRKVRGAAFTA